VDGARHLDAGDGELRLLQAEAAVRLRFHAVGDLAADDGVACVLVTCGGGRSVALVASGVVVVIVAAARSGDEQDGEQQRQQAYEGSSRRAGSSMDHVGSPWCVVLEHRRRRCPAWSCDCSHIVWSGEYAGRGAPYMTEGGRISSFAENRLFGSRAP